MIAPPQWARSIRFRLTLIYSGVLFGLAALLVASLYVSLRLSLGAHDQVSFIDAAGIAHDATIFERQVNEHVGIEKILGEEIGDQPEDEQDGADDA